MNKATKHSGLTLTELLVVIAVMAILMAIAVPAVKAIMDSFDSATGVRQLINAALSSARAIAIREQTYAGIRFQQDINGNTYMIFIIHDPTVTGLANGFKALPGRKPMKLPENIGVIDPCYFNRVYNSSSGDIVESQLQANAFRDDAPLMDNINYMIIVAGQEKNRNYLDATTLSIIFNASGKLSTKLVWVRNQHSISDTPGQINNNSSDTLFNKKDVVDGKYPLLHAMFYQDDYGGSPVAVYTQNYGIGPEWSRQSFLIFDKEDYARVPQDLRWTNCLSKSNTEYVSPYTGELMIEYRNAQNP